MKNFLVKSDTSSIKELVASEISLITDCAFKITENSQLLDQLHTLSRKIAATKYGKIRNVYFLSIGKSVPMLQKVEATMKSLGIPAFVLDAVHILHGDFGAITDKDLVIAVSKSGHTSELNTTLSYLKSQNIEFWYMTMAKPSDEVVANLVPPERRIDLPICLELDALSRVPTVSPIVFQIVFDVLALYASGHINGLDAQGFLKNHPGGDIGKFLRTI